MIEPLIAAAAITSGQLASSVVAVGGSLPRVRSQPSMKVDSPTRLASTLPSRMPIGMKRIFAITLPDYSQRAAGRGDRRRPPNRPLLFVVVIFPRIWVIALLVIGFLLASFFVARWLTAENRERNAVVDLLQFQNEGDAAGMLAAIEGCAQKPKCLADVSSNARRLSGGGPLKILRFDSAGAYAIGDSSGNSRVAWNRGGTSLAVVQCIAVERRGLAFLDGKVVLRSISRPIGRESPCPG